MWWCPEADAEGIIMMIDCFLAAGLTDFRIDIGQAEFYKGIMDALEASEEVKPCLKRQRSLR